ncbi:winged helix-turn-helix domain-containing protein [Streptomyces sp. NPDC054933]
MPPHTENTIIHVASGQLDQARNAGRVRPVPVLRWPDQAEQVQRFRSQGVPRLLILDGRARPPICVDPLEDWVRAPVDDAELMARSSALQARAAAEAPVIDDDDVVHFAGRRAPLADGEAELVRLLLLSYRSVVSREQLAVELWPDSGDSRRNALDLRVLRTRRRIAPLGLVITTVRRKGYLLDARRPSRVVAHEAPVPEGSLNG